MERKPFSYITVDVFTDRPFGGNPLAVFPEADGLSDRQMLQVAREMNLSETAFVQLPCTPRGDYRLRIFTPAGEIPFAGHPTVGTAWVLAKLGTVHGGAGATATVFLEEGVGPVPVRVRFDRQGQPMDGELAAAQLPETQPLPVDRAALASILGLPESAIAPLESGFEPLGVSCGLPFAVVPLVDGAAIAKIQFNRTAWEEHLSGTWAPSVYAIAPAEGSIDHPSAQRDRWRVRMFAPALGIAEDPATGSAATALGGYLGDRHPQTDGPIHWIVEQGQDIHRPSTLHVAIDKTAGQISAIRVRGAAVLLCEGTMHIPMDDPDLT
ncbi:MAG: PhzF family phenazine biosynthesis protein [Cyanophyceae cyanobacterium]